jgi:hypothetical protein
VALKAAPAEGRQERGQAEESIARVQRRRHTSARRGQVPFAVAAPGARLRQPPPTAAPPPPGRPPPPHVRSAAAGPGWAVPCPSHGWHDHQARQRPATVGTTLTPRQDGGTLRSQARLHPGSSDPPPIDAEVDSCGISPCGSVRAPARQQGLWSPARTGQCHLHAMGSARVRVRQVATWGRRPNAPGESAGGLDLAGVPPRSGC